MKGILYPFWIFGTFKIRSNKTNVTKNTNKAMQCISSTTITRRCQTEKWMIKLLEIISCIHIWRFTFFLTKWQTMSLGNNFSSLVPPWPYMKKWKDWKLIQLGPKGTMDQGTMLGWIDLGWVGLSQMICCEPSMITIWS